MSENKQYFVSHFFKPVLNFICQLFVPDYINYEYKTKESKK